MHKCLVCGNSSRKTRRTRSGVIYHGFPKNEYMRKKWLKVYGFDHCYDWHRICSDHFLDSNYKPGIKRFLFSNSIPQPYDGNCDKNGFPSNSVIQCNGVETESNEILPTKQNIINEGNIEDAIVNNIELSRQSCGKIKLTVNDEGMSYENMPRLQTDQFESRIPIPIDSDNIQTVIETNEVPVITDKTTMDHTMGFGLKCSVKSCFNRHSKDLSFFGYPKDFALRKKWIEKCGLKKDPTKIVINGIRVCSAHFENDCFKNSELKNRLKSGAVPSLLLDDDIIHARNIPPTSSLVNRSSTPANKSSCSSSNYVANVESNKTLLVYMESTTRNAKDFEAYCSIPGCITNTDKEDEDISLFAPTKECVDEWNSILGLQLTVNSVMCERHFRPQDILNPILIINGINEKFKSLAPNSLPLPINDVPVLRTYEDQFISLIDNEADEQLSETNENNILDITDECASNTSMPIDDSSTNTSLSIASEPIEIFEVIEPSVNLSISPTNKSNSPESLEITTPVTSNFISLSQNSDKHDSNTNYNINTSQCIIIDVDNNECFRREENGFIFNMSKKLILPSFFWKSEHLKTQNSTSFYQRNTSDVIVKQIHFYNSLVPIIQVYGKKYEYNTSITSLKKLEKLLEKIDGIEKCYGRTGFVFEKCIGYFENHSEDNYMCSACEGLVTKQDSQRMKSVIESKSIAIESLENKIAEKVKRVLKLRKRMAKIKNYRQLRLGLKSSGISKIKKP